MNGFTIRAMIVLAATALVMPVAFGHGNKPGTAAVSIGGGEVKVDFVGPSANGRDVLSLLPPGGYWRMGADRATTLTTDVDLDFGGMKVPKGTYKLVAHFDENQAWSLIVAEDLGGGFQPTTVVAKAAGRISKLDEPVENMTIKLEANGAKGKLVLDWGTARLTADFTPA